MMSNKKMLSYILINIAVVFFVGGTYFLVTQLRTTSLPKKQAIKEKSSPTKSEEINLPNIEEVNTSGAISIIASKQKYRVNEQINLQVVVNVDNKVIDGAEFELKYNPQLIRIDELQQGTFFPLYPKKDIDVDRGTIKLIALQNPGENNSASELVLATIQATALDKGTADIQFVKEKTHLAGYGGQELLEKLENLSLIIE
jgi:hypothetical protein